MINKAEENENFLKEIKKKKKLKYQSFCCIFDKRLL
jgi:hypothetical protein